LRAALEHRDAIVPELIAAIDRVSADPAHYLENHDDLLHHFAIHLLAQFRETRALDCFLRFFSLLDDAALDLTGDLVTEQGAAILASVCGGDPAPLLKLAHDEAVNEFVRRSAIDALAVQGLWGERPRESVVEELRKAVPPQIQGHFDRLLERGKRGVALVRHGVCSECHMRVAIGVLATLTHGDDIQLCGTCGRYLCLPEGEPIASPPPAPAPKAARKRRSKDAADAR